MSWTKLTYVCQTLVFEKYCHGDSVV